MVVLAQMHGGGHERGMRSGTLPTHQIAGMGEAARLVSDLLVADMPRIAQLRDRLWAGISALGGIHLNGSEQQCTPNHMNISTEGVDGEILLASLARIAVSSGSACTSASVEPSYVLKAIGLPDELAHAGLRFSLGRYTTAEQIDATIDEFSRVVGLLRKG